MKKKLEKEGEEGNKGENVEEGEAEERIRERQDGREQRTKVV